MNHHYQNQGNMPTNNCNYHLPNVLCDLVDNYNYCFSKTSQALYELHPEVKKYYFEYYDIHIISLQKNLIAVIHENKLIKIFDPLTEITSMKTIVLNDLSTVFIFHQSTQSFLLINNNDKKKLLSLNILNNQISEICNITALLESQNLSYDENTQIRDCKIINNDQLVTQRSRVPRPGWYRHCRDRPGYGPTCRRPPALRRAPRCFSPGRSRSRAASSTGVPVVPEWPPGRRRLPPPVQRRRFPSQCRSSRKLRRAPRPKLRLRTRRRSPLPSRSPSRRKRRKASCTVFWECSSNRVLGAAADGFCGAGTLAQCHLVFHS